MPSIAILVGALLSAVVLQPPLVAAQEPMQLLGYEVGTTGPCDRPPGKLEEICEAVSNILTTDEPSVWIDGAVAGASCTGTFAWVRDYSVPSTTVLKSGLLNSTLNGTQQSPPDLPAGTGVVEILALIVAVIGVTKQLVGEPDVSTEPYPELRWTYTCSAGYQLWANGGGSVLRSVVLEVPASDAGYTKVDSCEYDGILFSQCAENAFHMGPEGTTAGTVTSKSHLVGDFTNWELRIDPPLPVTADVCLNPGNRATNEAQIPLMDSFVRPAQALLEEPRCSSTCIDWNKNGCLAADD